MKSNAAKHAYGEGGGGGGGTTKQIQRCRHSDGVNTSCYFSGKAFVKCILTNVKISAHIAESVMHRILRVTRKENYVKQEMLLFYDKNLSFTLTTVSNLEFWSLTGHSRIKIKIFQRVKKK